MPCIGKIESETILGAPLFLRLSFLATLVTTVWLVDPQLFGSYMRISQATAGWGRKLRAASPAACRFYTECGGMRGVSACKVLSAADFNFTHEFLNSLIPIAVGANTVRNTSAFTKQISCLNSFSLFLDECNATINGEQGWNELVLMIGIECSFIYHEYQG